MAKRKRARLSPYPIVPHVDPSAAWTRETTYKVNGRILEPGTEFSVHGRGGLRFVFQRAVQTPSGALWLDAFELEKGAPGRYRSFHPDKVRTVHRLHKSRASLAA